MQFQLMINFNCFTDWREEILDESFLFVIDSLLLNKIPRPLPPMNHNLSLPRHVKNNAEDFFPVRSLSLISIISQNTKFIVLLSFLSLNR